MGFGGFLYQMKLYYDDMHVYFFSSCLVTIFFYVQVMKRPGVIIKPIEFEEVNPHENSQQRSGDKNKLKKNKGNDSNFIKKSKFKRKS